MSDEDTLGVLEKYNVIDRAAKKSDRWWFFALLVIGMVAIWFIYTDMRGERLAQNTKLEKMHDTIETFMQTTLQKTTEALDKNSAAVERNTTELQRVDATLDRVKLN